MVCLGQPHPVRGAGQTYYVSTSGSNGNNGSLNHPWRDIQYGADRLSAGDTLIIAPGIYSEGGIIVENGGTATNPITFKANGVGVIVQGSGSGQRQDAFLITNANYLVVDGITFRNSNRAGLRIDHSNHVTVRNSTFADNYTWGVFTDFSDYTLIENSESYGAVEQHGIYISNSSDYPTIRHNRLHDNASCGLHMNGDISMGGDGIISHGLVEGNIIYNNGAVGGSAINMDGVTDTLVRNNVLYDNHASGISLYQDDGGSGSKRNKIYNNTIQVPVNGRWAINIPPPDTDLPSSGNTGNQVYNNILYNQHPWHGVITIDQANLSGFASDYNVLMDRLSADGEDTVIPLAEWQAMGYDTHSFIATPAQLFAGAAYHNFHLFAASPAVDKGMTLADVPSDLEDHARPFGSAYDIGAYEYIDLPNKVYLPTTRR